jgi:hypothetical protein
VFDLVPQFIFLVTYEICKADRQMHMGCCVRVYLVNKYHVFIVRRYTVQQNKIELAEYFTFSESIRYCVKNSYRWFKTPSSLHIRDVSE